MMECFLSARGRTQKDSVYRSFKENGLEAKTKITKGSGTCKDPFCMKITISNQKESAWSGVIHVEVPFLKQNPRYFLPAVFYGRNRGETPQNVPNEFPRLREYTKRPSSPWWMVRSDRLSHPMAVVFDTDHIYGLSASPYFIKKDNTILQWEPGVEGEFYQYGGFTCSLEKGSVGYTLGYENAPWLFVQSHLVRERAELGENCFTLEGKESIEFYMDLYDDFASCALEVNEIIKEVYYRYHQSPRKASDVETAVLDLSHAVFEDAWVAEDVSYAGQVFEEEEGYRYNKIYSLSWTNGMSVATPMLMAGLRLKDEAIRKQALSCINYMMSNCMNPLTGLPYEAYQDGVWSNRGWWFDGMHTAGHSSYLIGQAMFYLLKAYEYEKSLSNVEHKDWLDLAIKVLSKIEKTKNSDGEYPFILSERTGAGIEYDSLAGTWCMAALAYYAYLTRDLTYLKGMEKSEQHYYDAFIKPMECYGAPLDTDKATDSEGILAYVKALRYLHAITKEKKYLEHMKDAIAYESSFKFCYNSPVKVLPLKEIGWSSCGGSVTSVANPHIHPMSSNLVDELIYYVKQTGDSYVKDRLNDTIGWGCQTYNTYEKEYGYGKKGWMSERFCHSEGLLVQKYSDGRIAGTWFCLMPWAIGSILDGLAGEVFEWEDRKGYLWGNGKGMPFHI